MTREERAREVLAKQHNGEMPFYVAPDFMPSWAIRAMLLFADAEAAAMRERAAGVCEAKMAEFADAENAGNDEAEEAWHSGMAHAASVLATAIRALPTAEVGK